MSKLCNQFVKSVKIAKETFLRLTFDFESQTNVHDSMDHRGNSFKDKNDNTDFSSISEVVLVVAKGEGGRDLTRRAMAPLLGAIALLVGPFPPRPLQQAPPPPH